LYVTTQTEFTQNPSDYHGTYEILVPPGGSSFCGNDQALLILDEIIDASEAVYAVPRVDEPLLAGEEYYAVGFGQQFDSGNAPSGIRQRRDFLYTQCVGSECEMSSIADEEWRGDTGVCSGDSGGPAFDIKHRVTGVASRGAPGCEFPIYGNPFGWAQWMKDSVIYASGLAGLAPPPWATGYPTDPAYSHPVGGACNGDPINCPSGACINDYCTRQCNELAPCPEGYDCTPDGWCAQIPESKPKKKPADDATTVSSCAVATPGLVLSEDPTKPIPWKWAAALLGAAWLVRRRD
jgi:MYXO-CTERM domain-containing protein